MKLFDTKRKRTFNMNGVTVIVNGVAVGRLTTIEVTDPDLAARIKEMPRGFSIGCRVVTRQCPFCGGGSRCPICGEGE